MSVIISNFNYGRFVAGAIDSALAQSYPSIEVVVVDDGSTDESRDVLHAYRSRATVVFKPNGGQASTFNCGFAHCHGEFICFLDADDRFDVDKVERIVGEFGRHPGAGWVFHRLRKVAAQDGAVIRLSHESGTGARDLRRFMRLGWAPFHSPSTSALCFRRTLLERIFPMPESPGVAISDNYLKDAAIALRPGFFLDVPLSTVLLHGDNASSKKLANAAVQAHKTVLTAVEMRRRIPMLASYCDRMVAKGWQILRRSGARDADVEALVATYLAMLPRWERWWVHALARAFPFRAIR